MNKKNHELIKWLIGCGAIAGPIYILLGLFQVVIRTGFDITRHDLSLMSNGELGWIQIGNFLLTGLLIILSAFGIRKVLKGTNGGTWGPILLAVYGIGLIGAGIFVADPMNGFPPGTSGNTITISGIMHLISGSIGFIGLIAACFVFARRFYKNKEKQWGNFSLVTGIIFFLAFFGIASGSQPRSPILTPVTLGFWVAVIISFTWLTMLSLKLSKDSYKHQE